MTTTEITCVSRIYGDGALLDFDYGDDFCALREDDEGGPTADVLLTLPSDVAQRAYDYCQNDNAGADPYADGYEAMECFSVATESEVVRCGVGWVASECARLGGCFLCGENHE